MWGTILVRLKILEGHIGLELFSPCTLSYNQGVPFCLLFFTLQTVYLGRSWLIHLLNDFQVFVMVISLLSLAFEFVTFL